MNRIGFTGNVASWQNNSGTTLTWQNNALTTLAWVSYSSTGAVRMADFVKITTASATYRFSTTPNVLTITLDGSPNTFDALGSLVKIGEATRDIKSTAGETSVTLVGIDTAMLGLVLSAQIKGSKIEMWHGFFDSDNVLINNGGTNGLYKFFTGYINSFAINEQWMADLRMYVGVVSISASSTQLILQNRTSGRYTNNNAWTYFNPSDTAMNRVNFVNGVNFQFGKGAAADS
jgi:hypothetical protein